MRTLVISDVHANLTALEAVIKDAANFDRVFCLGDLVGYGPDPNECIRLISSLPNLHCLMGNHDAAVLGFIKSSNFNWEAQQALSLQATMLSEESRHFLECLELEKDVSGIHMVHGSPRNPIWEYILDSFTALENFNAFSTQICLIGHSHVPSIFELNQAEKVRLLLPGHGDLWQSERRFILNPGSVGQPRDRNPKAAYLIFDDHEQTWQFRRVKYNVAEVQKRILQAGLIEKHAQRLERGI